LGKTRRFQFEVPAELAGENQGSCNVVGQCRSNVTEGKVIAAVMTTPRYQTNWQRHKMDVTRWKKRLTEAKGKQKRAGEKGGREGCHGG